MNIKLIRLNTGEDIIANLMRDFDDIIIISNPVVVIPSGRGELGFAPWAPLLSKEVEEIAISKNFVVYISDTQDQIIEQYNQIFSRIITPNKQIKL
jgi:hypothetical protein